MLFLAVWVAAAASRSASGALHLKALLMNEKRPPLPRTATTPGATAWTTRA